MCTAVSTLSVHVFVAYVNYALALRTWMLLLSKQIHLLKTKNHKLRISRKLKPRLMDKLGMIPKLILNLKASTTHLNSSFSHLTSSYFKIEIVSQSVSQPCISNSNYKFHFNKFRLFNIKQFVCHKYCNRDIF